MGRDGLLPPWTARLHPRFQTPHVTTLVCGLVVALLAAFTPIEKLAFLCNIGTLFAFFIVCLGVFVLRWTRPEAPRPFKIPGGKLVSLLGALASLGLMLSMPLDSWYGCSFGWPWGWPCISATGPGESGNRFPVKRLPFSSLVGPSGPFALSPEKI